MATRSIPIVEKSSNSLAISIFVPTPSVQVTRIGLSICLGILLRAEKDPRPERISGLRVFSTKGLIESTSSYPASTSTPESL